MSPELYSDSDGTDDEELSDDESYNDEDVGSAADFDDDSGHVSTGATSETGENEGANKVSHCLP